MTGSLPEPSHVGPIAGGNLRASDADRERVVAVLSTAYAEGRLSREEHDERLNQAMRARTFDDLPKTAQAYVTALEDLSGAPFASIGVGPDREQTLELRSLLP